MINLYFKCLKVRLINNINIGPIEKNDIIENMIFIKGLYLSGVISFFDCIVLLNKALI